MAANPSETASTGEPAWMARLPEAARERVRLGSSRLDPRRIGALVGIAGGLVFVLSNLAWAPAPLGIALRVLAVALAAATLAALFARPRALGAPAPVGVGAWWVYLASVAGMLGLIALARLALTASGHEAAIPIAIAVAVGLHFLPFARAFRERHFVDLAIALVTIGAVGVVAAIVVGEPAGEAAAVVAGIAMLALMLAYAVRGRALTAR
ncbi:hypothetical protein GCM10009846_03270 [Agrococcus versicolor]|uniref:Uncharacterized protein n=1 Tax=Agrococcus versicolor TaxID=501482 RepID=A0ABN3AK36_9MICO